MKKPLWGFIAFMCGITAISGINAFFRDFSADAGNAVPNLILGLVCIPLTVLCIRKCFKPKNKVSVQAMPPVRATSGKKVAPSPVSKTTSARPLQSAIPLDNRKRFDMPDEDIGRISGSDLSYLDAKALKFWGGKSTNYQIPAYYSESAFGRNAEPALRHFLKNGYLVTGGAEDRIGQKTVPELKKILSQNELKVSGNKPDLIHRLMDNLSPADIDRLFPVSVYRITPKGQKALEPYTIIFDSNSHALSFSSYRLLKEREMFPALSNEEILLKLLMEDIQSCLKSGDQFRYQELVLETGRYLDEIGRPEESLEYHILAYFMYHRQTLELSLRNNIETHPNLAMSIDRNSQQCGYSFNQLVACFETALRKHNPFGLCTTSNINKTIAIFKKSLSI